MFVKCLRISRLNKDVINIRNYSFCWNSHKFALNFNKKKSSLRRLFKKVKKNVYTIKPKKGSMDSNSSYIY